MEIEEVNLFFTSANASVSEGGEEEIFFNIFFIIFFDCDNINKIRIKNQHLSLEYNYAILKVKEDSFFSISVKTSVVEEDSFFSTFAKTSVSEFKNL